MADLHKLGDLIDVCLARSEGVLAQDDWDGLADLRRRVRQRSGFLGEVLVVALAGGTGSGKSSLLNALCRRQIATVGIERPTTSRSLAAIPTDVEGDVASFVASLGIDDTVEVAALDRTVFVDLPDFDSTFVDHRAVVENVLSVVDAVVWVLDPEKYADAMVHDEFIRPLSRYAEQMLFALNKADRLDGSGPMVVESLRLHLLMDGYSDPEIVTTVAAGTESVDLSTGELEAALARRLDIKRSATNRIASDVANEANRLWATLSRVDGSAHGPDAALAMASFVSLGVTAAEIRYRTLEGMAD